MEKKSFWKRPEGITGALVIGGLAVGAILSASTILAVAQQILSNTISTVVGLGVLTGVVYMFLDPSARNLVWYAYKSVMRWVTGLFVQIDPISILKSYIEDLDKNLRNLSKQIGALRGQMRQLRGIMDGNNAEITRNMQIADKANQGGDEKNRTLSARKAGRLQEANSKYEVLMQKMEVLYRMLTKMYENSEIMLEDTRDQVQVREQEYKAIQASHSAIRSAMNILKGDPDQRAMFEQATEALAEEVSQKVGEMERFMHTSRNLMDSIDLQNGVFEDEGMRMLEEWEQQSPLLGTNTNAKKTNSTAPIFDINQPRPEPIKETRSNDNAYHDLFE